jgi:hypothetical protein
MGTTILLLLVTVAIAVAVVVAYTGRRRRRARAVYQRRLEAAVADGILTPDEIAELDRLREEKELTPVEVRIAARATYRTILREALKDSRLTPAEDQTLLHLQAQLGLSDRDLGEDREQLSRLRTLARLEAGQLPVIEVPIELAPNEQAHWLVQAAFAERLDLPSPGRRGLRAVTLPIESDMPFSADGERSALRPAEDILPNDLGIIVITSRRTVFQGAKGSVSIAHARLLSLHVYADGFRVDELDGTTRGYFLAEDAELTAAVLLHAARKRRREIRPAGFKGPRRA